MMRRYSMKTSCVLAAGVCLISLGIQAFQACPTEELVGNPTFLGCPNLYKEERKQVSWPTNIYQVTVKG
jgi:hypothetical protein